MLINFDPKILVKKEHYSLTDDYFNYLKFGLMHFANNKFEKGLKVEKLELLEKALRKNFPLKKTLIGRLQKGFVENNLSLYLLLDPHYAWRYLANGKLPTSEAQLSEFNNLFISPAARFIMALYDENPATYQPLTSLFSVLLLLDMWHNKSQVVSLVKLSKRQKVSKLKGLIKSAVIIMSLVKSKRLKFKLSITHNTAKLLVKKYEKNEQLKITLLDKILIFLYSCFQFVSIKRRTIEKVKI